MPVYPGALTDTGLLLLFDGGVAVEHFVEGAEVDGLGEDVVHAGFAAAGDFPVHGAGGEGQDRRGDAGLAESFCGFEAVEDGHVVVHQDEVERLFTGPLDGFGTIFYQRHLHPLLLEQADDHALVHFVVLGDEDTH